VLLMRRLVPCVHSKACLLQLIESLCHRGFSKPSPFPSPIAEYPALHSPFPPPESQSYAHREQPLFRLDSEFSKNLRNNFEKFSKMLTPLLVCSQSSVVMYGQSTRPFLCEFKGCEFNGKFKYAKYPRFFTTQLRTSTPLSRHGCRIPPNPPPRHMC